MGVSGFPNYLTFCGPYGPVAHGSLLPLIESWTRYIIQIITKVQEEHIKSLAPKAEAARQFRQHADTLLERTVWTGPCCSWFRQGRREGQVPLWPGSRLHHLEVFRRPRYEDFDIEYCDEGGNRFAFLGNGFALREFDGRDLTWYMGSLDPEGRDVQPEYDERLLEILGGRNCG